MGLTVLTIVMDFLESGQDRGYRERIFPRSPAEIARNGMGFEVYTRRGLRTNSQDFVGARLSPRLSSEVVMKRGAKSMLSTSSSKQSSHRVDTLLGGGVQGRLWIGLSLLAYVRQILAGRGS